MSHAQERRAKVLAYVTEHPGCTPSEVIEALDEVAADVRHDLHVLLGDGRVTKQAGKPTRWTATRKATGRPLPRTKAHTGDPHALKKCAGCGMMKNLISFDRDKTQDSGVDTHCKKCRGTTWHQLHNPTEVEAAERSVAAARRRDERIAQRDAAWVAEGVARLRENTDAVRPVRGG